MKSYLLIWNPDFHELHADYEIDALVSQLSLTPEEEDFAREQAFDLRSSAYIDAYPRVRRARAATAAAVIAFSTLKVWAEHDEASGQ